MIKRTNLQWNSKPSANIFIFHWGKKGLKDVFLRVGITYLDIGTCLFAFLRRISTKYQIF